jgi:hypothetical protein
MFINTGIYSIGGRCRAAVEQLIGAARAVLLKAIEQIGPRVPNEICYVLRVRCIKRHEGALLHDHKCDKANNGNRALYNRWHQMCRITA